MISPIFCILSIARAKPPCFASPSRRELEVTAKQAAHSSLTAMVTSVPSNTDANGSNRNPYEKAKDPLWLSMSPEAKTGSPPLAPYPHDIPNERGILRPRGETGPIVLGPAGSSLSSVC